MDDLIFGLQIAVVGIACVVALLAVLMGVVWLLGRMDRQPAPPPAPAAAPITTTAPADLPSDLVAAINIAVLTHAEVRRAEAAPAMRTHQPGSHLYASRWVATGRGSQSQPWQRRT